MSTLRERFDEHPVAITALAMLGLGLTAAIAEIEQLAALFFTVGLCVVVPLVFLLYDSDEPDRETGERSPETAAVEDDPVEELRRRYAAGELSEAEFERKLDRLLETEDLAADESAHAASALERELE